MKYYVGMPMLDDQNKVTGHRYYNFETLPINVGIRTVWVDRKEDAYAFDSETKAKNVIGGDDRLKGCVVLT